MGLFRGTQAEFPDFLDVMNSVDKDIRFTSEINWTENKVVFLDLIITIDQYGYLQTDSSLSQMPKIHSYFPLAATHQE